MAIQRLLVRGFINRCQQRDHYARLTNGIWRSPSEVLLNRCIPSGLFLMVLSVLIPLMYVEDCAARIFLTSRSTNVSRARYNVKSPAILADGVGPVELPESKSVTGA